MTQRPDEQTGTAAVPRATKILVGGDVTVDWNLARQSLHADASPGGGARASWQRGGAALLGDLIRGAADGMPGEPVSVCAPEGPGDRPVAPDDVRHNHSYAVWSRFGVEVGDRARPSVWRVASFLGVDPARTSGGVDEERRRVTDEAVGADLLVFDDADLGFRDAAASLPTGGPATWVVLKQARPVARGALWERLLDEAAERLVVVLTIDDLRGREIQVSRALSWERTAQDLLWELVNKPSVNALSRVAHTVVSFGCAGAVLLSTSGGGDPTCRLLYDPASVEGEWEARHRGQVMGATSCMTTALVRELLLDPEAPDLGRGIHAGVEATRALHRNGYEATGPGRLELGFPRAAVLSAMDAPGGLLQEVDVPAPGSTTWTILEDRCGAGLEATATEIVRQGSGQALEGVPVARFAKLETADRGEIEAFRSVASLIAEYVRDPPSRPLSLAVFGPPGSGKSFGVKQVAASVGGDRIVGPLEFNLSQLGSPDELVDAFHLVRDRALGGAVPLVFWDEFDTALDGRPLGWLRYFLAPMQDGEFRQGQVTHPLGSCIFVFAGGTCARLEDFGRDLGGDDHDTVLRQAKAPDFVSRLKGFVDVLGPNPLGGDPAADAFYVVRRAILLRSIVCRQAPQLLDGDTLNIDEGVLRAFLGTAEFRHGARSLEAVVATSRLAGRSFYERSSLPPAAQLELHVEADDFLSLVQRPELEGDLLERMARAAHDVYGRGQRAEDPSYHHQPFEDLAEHKQDENRANARDIPAKLAEVGCLMVPASTARQPVALGEREVERLARREHDRWMRDLGPGWEWGDPTDVARKRHVAYLPWTDLPDGQKEIDRNLVREIPAILQAVGYAIVRHPSEGSTPDPP